jgi:hypothetical protein
MNPIYFFLIIPLIAPLLVLYFTKRNIKDNLLPLIGFSLAGALVLGLSLMAINGYASRDVETLNGFVTTKEINRFTCPVNTGNPCENGYDCHCHTVTYACGTDDKGNTTYCSREECDKCYEYAWEQNFYVASSLQGDRAYKIARIDEQGSQTPPRWSAVRHGDPVSITNSYTNYILAASDSLFSEDGAAEEKYKSKIPAYPQSIFDYYRVNRLVTGGNVKLDAAAWNEQISRILVQVGPRKQANVVVVVAEGVGMDYANAVRRAWRGFKKNDIVVFAGVDAAGNMVWTRTLSWSKDSMVNIKIESDILARFQGKPLEPVAFTQIVKANSLAFFSRRSMEDFAYLKDEASLSSTQMVWIWILSIVLGIGSVFASLAFLDALPHRAQRTMSYVSRPLRRFRP